jgi:hypothetical protein
MKIDRVLKDTCARINPSGNESTMLVATASLMILMDNEMKI